MFASLPMTIGLMQTLQMSTWSKSLHSVILQELVQSPTELERSMPLIIPTMMERQLMSYGRFPMLTTSLITSFGLLTGLWLTFRLHGLHLVMMKPSVPV